jgi:hypothetical protein
MTARRPSVTMAWALVVLCLLAGYAGVAGPLLELYRERQTRLDLLDEAILQRSARIAGGPALAATRDRLAAGNADTDAIIASRDTSAVAQLQEHLRLAAAAQTLRVETLSVLSERALEPFREVAVRATLSGSVAQVQGLLHRLETGTPAIQISELSLLGRPGAADLEITLEMAGLAESTSHAD